MEPTGRVNALVEAFERLHDDDDHRHHHHDDDPVLTTTAVDVLSIRGDNDTHTSTATTIPTDPATPNRNRSPTATNNVYPRPLSSTTIVSITTSPSVRSSRSSDHDSDSGSDSGPVSPVMAPTPPLTPPPCMRPLPCTDATANTSFSGYQRTLSSAARPPLPPPMPVPLPPAVPLLRLRRRSQQRQMRDATPAGGSTAGGKVPDRMTPAVDAVAKSFTATGTEKVTAKVVKTKKKEVQKQSPPPMYTFQPPYRFPRSVTSSCGSANDIHAHAHATASAMGNPNGNGNPNINTKPTPDSHRSSRRFLSPHPHASTTNTTTAQPQSQPQPRVVPTNRLRDYTRTLAAQNVELRALRDRLLQLSAQRRTGGVNGRTRSTGSGGGGGGGGLLLRRSMSATRSCAAQTQMQTMGRGMEVMGVGGDDDDSNGEMMMMMMDDDDDDDRSVRFDAPRASDIGRAKGNRSGNGRARAFIAAAAAVKRKSDVAKGIVHQQQQEQTRIPLATLIN